MHPKKKIQPPRQEGGLLSQVVVFVVGLVILIGAVYGIVFFVTERAVGDVEKVQGYIEQDLTKLGSRLSDIQEKLTEKIATEDANTKQGQDSGKPDGEGEQMGSFIVGLYYYNLRKDEEIDPSLPCSPDAVLPVRRQMPFTATPIQDTIHLLISGDLTDEEKIAGFTTEFPHPEFKLLGTKLKDSVLTLEFTNPKDFTTGGSCRVSLLKAQIEKTALQFEGVKEVKFEPEIIFQP